MNRTIKIALSIMILFFSFSLVGDSAPLNKKDVKYLGKNVADTLNMNVLVPAYFDPSASNYWNRLAIQAAKFPGHIYAIANVYNGPGSQYETGYAKVINTMHDSSGKVIGYIHTTYGNRSLSEVEADVDSWYSFYPSLDGIFIDEQDNTSGNESYYASLYNYVKQKDSTSLVVTNPGTNTIESYLFNNGKRIADVICIFESNTGFDSWIPSTWCSNYSSSNFYVLPYNSSSSQYVDRVKRAASLNVGWIYCTSDGGSNPWDTLPQYFEDFCSYAVTGKDSTSTSQSRITIDGNFNDWSGISTLNSSSNPLDPSYSSDNNANFTNVWAANDSSNFYLSYQVAGSITSSYFYHIFIDTDRDSSGETGYVYNDSASIVAEFMVENDGLWLYNGTGGSNWSWISEGGINKSDKSGRTELSIPLDILLPNGSNHTLRIILQTNQSASPYSLMDTAPNDYKTEYYTYEVSNLTDIKRNEVNNIDFHLDQNYPNPFNPSTIINYQIPKSGLVSLRVYNILGKEVKTLVNKAQSAGNYSISFNSNGEGLSLPSGIYFYKLQSGSLVQTKKMILLK